MTRLRVFLCRLSGLLRTRNLERDLDEELDYHLQMEIAENHRRGMPPDRARSAALQRFGGVARVKETYRETHSLPFFQVLWQDLRFGSRMLRRNPGFSSLAILCLTLGIGANAAIFSLIRTILLAPLPFSDPAQLVFVQTVPPNQAETMVAPMRGVSGRPVSPWRSLSWGTTARS